MIGIAESAFVGLAAISWIVGHRRPSAKLTNRSYRKNRGHTRLGFVILENVFRAYIAGGEYRDKRRRRGSLFHTRTALRLFALHQTHGSHYIEPKLASSFNRLDRRCSRSTDVVHNHHARALLAKALDALPGAMLLFGLAHQKSMKLTATHRCRHHDRIGSHRQPTYCCRLPSALADLFDENFSRQ